MKKILAFLLIAACVLASAAWAEELSGYVYIYPENNAPMTENGYVLTGDTVFEWSAEYDAYTYAYLVEDLLGYDVPGYCDGEMTQSTSLELRAADFEKDKTYAITVYAYSGKYDDNPDSGTQWFRFDSGSSGFTLNFVDRTALYRTFCDNNFAPDTPVVLADVTGDGQNEMIVLYVTEEVVTGNVYTVSSQTGQVELIYQNSMLTFHGGGVCGWYLVPQETGGWALVEETDELWQGIGNVSFMEYRLTETGAQVPMRNLWLSSEEPGCVDDNGLLLESLIEEFGDRLGEVISGGYVIYRSGSQYYGNMLQLYMDSEYTLQDGAPLTADYGGYADPAQVIADKGLIAMMAMSFDAINSQLTDVAWFDSFDYPGLWFVSGTYGMGYVYMEYYELPTNDDAYPYNMTVSDYSGGTAYMPVTDKLYTGMSWGQVKSLEWYSIGDMEPIGDNEGGMVTAYPEQGCIMTMIFNDYSEYGVLTNVTIEYFE